MDGSWFFRSFLWLLWIILRLANIIIIRICTRVRQGCVAQFTQFIPCTYIHRAWSYRLMTKGSTTFACFTTTSDTFITFYSLLLFVSRALGEGGGKEVTIFDPMIDDLFWLGVICFFPSCYYIFLWFSHPRQVDCYLIHLYDEIIVNENNG